MERIRKESDKIFPIRLIKHDEPRSIINLDFKELSYDFYLKKFLEDRLNRTEYFDKVDTCLKLLNARILSHHNIDFEIKKLSKPTEISLNLIYIKSFISQALELFEAAESMTILAKPLVVYYAHLNLIKALSYATLKFDTKLYSMHGLEPVSGDPYKASTKLVGFYTLFLASLGNYKLLEENLDKTKDNPFQFSNLINSFEVLTSHKLYEHFLKYTNFLNKSFIISFMLSTVTRYQPLLWQKKQDGTTESYISQINRFYAEVAEYQFKIAILSFLKGDFLSYSRPLFSGSLEDEFRDHLFRDKL